MLQLEYDSKEFVKICPAQNFMKIEETQNRHILPQSNDCMAIRAHIDSEVLIHNLGNPFPEIKGVNLLSKTHRNDKSNLRPMTVLQE